MKGVKWMILGSTLMLGCLLIRSITSIRGNGEAIMVVSVFVLGICAFVYGFFRKD